MQIHRTIFHVLNALPDFFLSISATNIEIRKRVFCCCRVIHELQVVLVSLFLSRTAVTTNVRTCSVFWKTISSCLLWKRSHFIRPPCMLETKRTRLAGNPALLGWLRPTTHFRLPVASEGITFLGSSSYEYLRSWWAPHRLSSSGKESQKWLLSSYCVTLFDGKYVFVGFGITTCTRTGFWCVWRPM